MLEGEIYNPNYDKELIKERAYAKNICFEYNNLNWDKLEKREELIKKLFGKIGSNFVIEPNFWCDYGYNIFIGKNFYANHGLVILDGGKVEIGDNVFIGPDCGIYTATHPIVDIESRNKEIK